MGNNGLTEKTKSAISSAVSLIRGARYLTAFTGAGISVESGIPPFRGPGGLWSQYDPRMLELDYFLAHPDKSWPILREIFYDHFGKARPNKAHEVLARLENEGWPRESAARGEADGGHAPGSTSGPDARGRLQVLNTQNIDNLCFETGSRNVIESHTADSRKQCAELTPSGSRFTMRVVLCYL